MFDGLLLNAVSVECRRQWHTGEILLWATKVARGTLWVKTMDFGGLYSTVCIHSKMEYFWDSLGIGHRSMTI